MVKACSRFISLVLFFPISIAFFYGCNTRHLVSDNPSSISQREISEPIRLALVLGGGGARGMAHVGVLYEFEREGIPIDVLVGCSAGSIVGALYADCPNAEYIKKLITPLRLWEILDVNIWHCRYGFVQGGSLRKFLTRCLSSRTFHELKIPLYVVSTDVYSGRLVTFSKGAIIPAVHASAAVPFVFAPVVWCDRLLVDGGVADPIPVKTAKDIGAEIVIAVDLSELLTKTCPNNLFGVASRSAEIKFLLQSESCADGADVLIRPDLGAIGMFDDSNFELVFQAGRKAAQEAMPKIKQLLAEKNIPLNYTADL